MLRIDKTIADDSSDASTSDGDWEVKHLNTEDSTKDESEVDASTDSDELTSEELLGIKFMQQMALHYDEKVEYEFFSKHKPVDASVNYEEYEPKYLHEDYRNGFKNEAGSILLEIYQAGYLPYDILPTVADFIFPIDAFLARHNYQVANKLDRRFSQAVAHASCIADIADLGYLPDGFTVEQLKKAFTLTQAACAMHRMTLSFTLDEIQDFVTFIHEKAAEMKGKVVENSDSEDENDEIKLDNSQDVKKQRELARNTELRRHEERRVVHLNTKREKHLKKEDKFCQRQAHQHVCFFSKPGKVVSDNPELRNEAGKIVRRKGA